MGCCISRKTFEAEEFVVDNISQMKISSLTHSEVKSKIKEMATMKSIITKKDFMLGIKHISNSSYYEIKIYNEISSNLSDKFSEADLMFYLFAFINFGVREDSRQLLFETFAAVNQGVSLSVATLQKYLVDYISFYTSHINNVFIHKVKKEHEGFTADLSLLNEQVYSSKNINSEVNQILKDKDEHEIIDLASFLTLEFRINICNFKEMRDSFCYVFDGSA